MKVLSDTPPVFETVSFRLKLQTAVRQLFCRTAVVLFLLLAITISACSAKEKMPGEGVFAKIKTSRGVILAQLEYRKTPLTVMSFVGLAEGRFDVPDSPNVTKGKHYFDGLTFHRIEPGFVIQGGDPDGNGTGGPGYQFPNEIHPGLNHDTEGILSMANAGPDTNGSQFFITLGPASFLNGNYSVFGHVIRGMDVAKSIEKGDRMEKITIFRQGANAKAFLPSWEQFRELSEKTAGNRKNEAAEFAKKGRQALLDFSARQWPDLKPEKDDNGLESYIIQKGSGPTGSESGNVKTYRLNYTLWTQSGSGEVSKVDSSLDPGREPIQLSPEQVIPGWGLTMPQMQVGEKRVILVPPDLGYGERGSPPAIPPNSYLLFEMELLEPAK
ncbi:peptidylprolyl isomerase [Candidatus Haliotispira prima]|uniref:peptidylprolyl isomerase n=1 Tax=Candidatus Haliotispira prima TaxID=3034016 RepID=A0ABY8MKZ5_9SPIO|nr:peptidylprolyl isomerase [Candidatus Haliotispira prima]